MTDKSDRGRGEQPARSLGVHWPSNPNPEPVATPELAATPEPTSPAAVPVPDVTAAAGLPMDSSPKEPVRLSDPETPKKPSRVSAAPVSMPPPPPPMSAPPVSAPPVSSPPVSAPLESSLPQSAPVSAPVNAPSVVPPANASSHVEPLREIPPVEALPVVDPIPVPQGSPGLRVDPLFGDVIPGSVVPPAVPHNSPVVPEARSSESAGLSRRELRRLREQAQERIGDAPGVPSQIDAIAAQVSTPAGPVATPPAYPTSVAPAAAPVQSPYSGSDPLSTTLPGVPAIAAEMAAITGRLNTIESGQGIPGMGASPQGYVALPDVSSIGSPLDSVLDSRVPSVSTTGGVPTSGHSLIVTNIPTDVPSALSAMNETGEIIVTGQIILPSSVAQTGIDARRLDTSEIDIVSESEPHVVTNTGRLAPVSATRAVSAFTTSTSTGMVAKRSSHRGTTALIVTGAAVGIIALGSFVTYLLVQILGA